MFTAHGSPKTRGGRRWPWSWTRLARTESPPCQTCKRLFHGFGCTRSHGSIVPTSWRRRAPNYPQTRRSAPPRASPRKVNIPNRKKTRFSTCSFSSVFTSLLYSSTVNCTKIAVLQPSSRFACRYFNLYARVCRCNMQRCVCAGVRCTEAPMRTRWID
jgi:hypothetical protein